MKSAVFLDRDGVINKAFVRGGKSYPPDRIEDFELIAGVEEACHDLKQAGYLLIVATNQPDVATGKQTQEAVEAMHSRLRDLLPLDEIYVCFHVGKEGCACRKPKPGMLVRAAEEHDIDLTRSFMVGDRWKDIEAGVAAGCRTFFIDYGYAEKRPQNHDFDVADLLSASRKILEL